MCVFPCIVLTPFEPWFVVVLLITVCCTDSVDLSLWSVWLLSCFCCPFSRVCGLRMSLTWRWTICSPSDHHQPMVRQKCLRWLNRLKTEPVAFPRAHNDAVWKTLNILWVSRGLLGAFRVESWELRTERYDYLMSWEQRRLYPAAVTPEAREKICENPWHLCDFVNWEL